MYVRTNVNLREQESRAIAGEPRDAAVNFVRYRILQRHRTCGFPATAWLFCWYLSADCSESAVKKWQVPERTSQMSDRISNADK